MTVACGMVGEALLSASSSMPQARRKRRPTLS
jgi:hypothetical protein